MSNISNIQELNLEIKRLDALSIHHENRIKQEINQIQEAITPSHILKSSMSGLLEDKTEANNLFSNSIGVLLGVVLKNTLFSKYKGSFGRLISYGAEILVSKFLHSKSDSILGLFKKDTNQTKSEESITST